MTAASCCGCKLLSKELKMKRTVLIAGMCGFILFIGAGTGHAEKWVKNSFDVPNQNLESNLYDFDSVKAHGKTISWTEKFILTTLGVKSYSKHLKQYPVCSKSMETKGDVTYHKIDFEIKEGKFRTIAKRNYNKANELVCSEKDMGNELDTKWYEIENKSPMSERYYILVTKHKVGNL